MKSSELKVVGLSITEDFYSYKGTFRLYGGDEYVIIDLAEFNGDRLEVIREKFGIDEPAEELRNVIMSRVIEAASLESRNVQGKA